MKHYSSWDEKQSREFLAAYDKTEERSSDRRALLRAARIDTKDSTQAIKSLRRKASTIVEEQTALALPAEKTNGASSRVSPTASIKDLPVDDPRAVKTKELRMRLLKEYHALPPRSDERRQFLADNGLKDWQMSQWAAALGLRPGQPGSKWAQKSAAAKAEGTTKPRTANGGRPVSDDEIRRRGVTRDTPAEERLRIVREYLALPARDGSRTRFARAQPYSHAIISYWVMQYRKGLIPGSGVGGKTAKRLRSEDDVEELSAADEPAREANKKVPYADLLQQNLILKGLLSIAESQGFDLKTILKFGK